MRKVSYLVVLTVFALAGMARAQEAAPAEEAPAPPADDAAAAAVPAPEAEAAAAPAAAPAAGTDYVSRGLTLSAGNLQVLVPIVLNLSKDAVLKPVWVPLDLRYGITDELEVFLNHGAIPGFPIATGFSGVCIGGEDRGCDKLYNNLNVGAQFSLLKDAAMELAALGALAVESLDPSTLSAVLGVNFKYLAGPVAIKAAPMISIGATKRDEGNKEALMVPLQLAFQATPELAAYLNTGIWGPLDHFGDFYSVPVGVGASFSVMPNLDVGGEFILPAVLTGMEGDEAFDMRMLALFAAWRLN
jgi:hypothetical protein